MSTKKKSQGRQKIEIKKLEKKSSKLVTFSKRRAGLLKKAAELSLLCGCEVGVIISSPSDKLFCFGHPTVDGVVGRFLNGSTSPPELAESCIPVAEFNRRHAEAMSHLEKEKRNAAAAAAQVVVNNGSFWWDKNEANIEDMEMEELKQYTAALLEIRRKVAERIEGMKVGGGGTLIPPQNHHFHC